MNTKYTSKEIRIWALVMAAILTAVGAIQFILWSHVRTANTFWILAVVFLSLGLIYPMLLKPIYWGWLKFAAALAWVNTRLILGIIFYLVFTPVGLILRLLRKDLLKQRWESNANSYWIKRPDDPFDPSRYEKQY